MSSRTAPYDFQQVRGYPKSLQIYRIPASRFWQVRFFVERKYIRKSTKCEDRKDAIEFAKHLYDSVRINQRLDINVHTDTFHACAKRLLKSQEAMINRGERGTRINIEDRKKLDKDILPFFATMGVGAITTATIEDYINEITSQRKLSPSTLSKHLIVIRKVLNEARKQGYISVLPPFPKIRRKDNPRPYFTLEEYKKLRDTAKELAGQNLKVRYVPLTEEIRDFIIFHVNVFVRPSDLKLLKHKHVVVKKEKKARYLLITPPNSKTVTRESASMEQAVRVYERLKERHENEGMGDDDDYVFFPQYRNREYALQTIRRQFEFVLEQASLKYDRLGRARTIYSLRHSALMFRYLKSDTIDIFFLAKNALTSVDQLHRFYLSHAESRKKIENLQSMA